MIVTYSKRSQMFFNRSRTFSDRLQKLKKANGNGTETKELQLNIKFFYTLSPLGLLS